MSRTFVQSLGLIMVAEAVTIGVAWRLLDSNADHWLQQRAEQLVALTKDAVKNKRVDWSHIDQVPAGKPSKLLGYYQDRLSDLNAQYFPRNEGSIYIPATPAGYVGARWIAMGAHDVVD
jgi:hypothetical protein